MPSLVPAEAAVTNNDPPATPRTCQHLSKHFRHHQFIIIIIIIYISVRIKKTRLEQINLKQAGANSTACFFHFAGDQWQRRERAW